MGCSRLTQFEFGDKPYSGQILPSRRIARVVTDTAATPEAAERWPGRHVRRAALFLALVCAIGLYVFSAASASEPGLIPAGTDLLASLGSLKIAIPGVSAHQPFGGWWILVVLGDPRVFAACLLALGSVALYKRDLRLIGVCMGGPVLAEVAAQFVGKPTFYELHGGLYGYPSGHATAAITVCCAAAILIRRLFGRRSAAYSLAPLALVAFVGTIGVVINDMHPSRDAIGAVFNSIGVMSLVTAVVFALPVPRRLARSR